MAMKQLQRANEILIKRFHLVSSPENVVLDLDSTNAAAYGNQYFSAFNPHYGENGYHPMLMFDGMTGDCLKLNFGQDPSKLPQKGFALLDLRLNGTNFSILDHPGHMWR
jgi:hypothetical protein